MGLKAIKSNWRQRLPSYPNLHSCQPDHAPTCKSNTLSLHAPSQRLLSCTNLPGFQIGLGCKIWPLQDVAMQLLPTCLQHCTVKQINTLNLQLVHAALTLAKAVTWLQLQINQSQYCKPATPHRVPAADQNRSATQAVANLQPLPSKFKASQEALVKPLQLTARSAQGF